MPERTRPSTSTTTEIKGTLPNFGTGIQTQLEDSGLFSPAGFELVYATAKVPVQKSLPLMRRNGSGVLEEVGHKEVYEEEQVRTLLGIAGYETKNHATKFEEHVVRENGQTYVLQTANQKPPETIRAVHVFSGTQLLQMDAQAMIRFHTVEATGHGNIQWAEGVLETRSMSDPEHTPTYTYARVTLFRENGGVREYRIEEEQPFQRRNV